MFGKQDDVPTMPSVLPPEKKGTCDSFRSARPERGRRRRRRGPPSHPAPCRGLGRGWVAVAGDDVLTPGATCASLPAGPLAVGATTLPSTTVRRRRASLRALVVGNSLLIDEWATGGEPPPLSPRRAGLPRLLRRAVAAAAPGGWVRGGEAAGSRPSAPSPFLPPTHARAPACWPRAASARAGAARSSRVSRRGGKSPPARAVHP